MTSRDNNMGVEFFQQNKIYAIKNVPRNNFFVNFCIPVS